MTSFPHHLRNRELGLPQAQRKIVQTMEQKTAQHLASDCYSSETIKFPDSYNHKIYRCQDFVAVFSRKITDEKVQKLSLWSLITRCKLWDIEIDPNYTTPSLTPVLSLSDQGMALINSISNESKIIILDGKQTGTLPHLNWHSIIPIGNRVLGCWAERHNPNDQEPCRMPRNSSFFHGEWNEKGERLSRYLLDHTINSPNQKFVCNENYWVRLLGSSDAKVTSIIEVIDRVTKTMKTFELPLSQDEEQFSSACIVQNRLFFGKSSLRFWKKSDAVKTDCEPTIYIFDLVKGAILGEFPTGTKTGTPKSLVANQNYAVWLDCRRRDDDRLQYLDILNKTVKNLINVPYCDNDSKVDLNIVGTVLSVTYGEGDFYTGWAGWRRKIIDMSTGKKKCDVRYYRLPWGECSFSNGNMVITDNFSKMSKICIESFTGTAPLSKESFFRIKST